MHLGFIGLGRMGGNMVRRLLAVSQVAVTVYDRDSEAVRAAAEAGATPAESVPDLVNGLDDRPRVVWLMLPSGQVTESVFQEVLALLSSGDILIDGANSRYHDTIRRAEQARARGVRMLDVGVSGGIIAADHGYPMMIGGPREAFEACRPIFEGMGLADGWDLVGETPGSGHYVKMIHNAIEYGMMQAIAEGFDLLAGGNMKYLDLHRIASIWNHGTIVSSFLMRMVESALAKNASLEGIAPHVDDSGEGRWSALEAIEHGIPFVANTYALHARFASRDEDSLAMRLLAAMRQEFGGHAIKTEPEK